MTTLDHLEALADAATPWQNKLPMKTLDYNGTILLAANPQTIKALIALCRMQHEALLWNRGGEPLPSKEAEALAAFEQFGKEVK
jgi:hypothetical protein